MENKYNQTIRKEDRETLEWNKRLHEQNFLELKIERNSLSLLNFKMEWLIYLYLRVLILKKSSKGKVLKVIERILILKPRMRNCKNVLNLHVKWRRLNEK